MKTLHAGSAKTIFLFGFLSLVAVVLWSRFQQATVAHSSNANEATLIEFVHDQATGIEYGLSVENATNYVYTTMYADTSTPEKFAQYVKFSNRELAKNLQSVGPKERIQLLITFKQPLDESTFVAFVEKYQLEVEKYMLFGLENDGRIVSIQGGPSDGELIPKTQVDMAKNNPDHAYNFLGWAEVTVYVESNKTHSINNDSLVYAVAAPELLYKHLLTAEKLNKAGIKDQKRQDQILKGGISHIEYPGFGYDLYYINHPEKKPKGGIPNGGPSTEK